MQKSASLSLSHAQMILSKIPFFREFTPSERERMAENQTAFVIARPKEMIVHKGDEGRSFYILLSGTASVLCPNSSEENELVALEPGDIFGEIAFLSNSPRTTDVRASEVCILMMIDRAMMAGLRVDIREKIKDQLIHKLVQRILDQS